MCVCVIYNCLSFEDIFKDMCIMSGFSYVHVMFVCCFVVVCFLLGFLAFFFWGVGYLGGYVVDLL